MRNALHTNSLSRWIEHRDNAKNYIIPYIVTGDFGTFFRIEFLIWLFLDPEERAIIFGAMGAIERNTCLRFKKRSDEKDYVDIRNEGIDWL